MIWWADESIYDLLNIQKSIHPKETIHTVESLTREFRINIISAITGIRKSMFGLYADSGLLLLVTFLPNLQRVIE